MKTFIKFASSALWFILAAILPTICARSHAEDIVITNVDVVEVRAAAPAAAAQEAKPATPAADKEAKKKDDKKTEGKPKDAKAKGVKPAAVANVKKLPHPILYPTIYPNPLAFNMAWVAITNKTFADVRALANRNKVVVRRRAVVRAQPNAAAANNAIQMQVRKFLEPVLKTELSFAARVTDLNSTERAKLVADGKKWFGTFLVDFMKKQDPNQQQMMLQGMQGVWFGNQQQNMVDPRAEIQVGVAKLVKDTLCKERAAAYDDECKKRAEFARQATIDNMVERMDEKLRLSPDQWQKIRDSIDKSWDRKNMPQLEAFAINSNMWPGVPQQAVIGLLSPAQQAMFKRVNAMSGRMFFGGGGAFGQMFGGNAEVIDDIELDGADAKDKETPTAAVVPAEELGPAVE